MASTFTITSQSFEGRYMYLTCTQAKDIATNKSKIKWTLTVTGGSSNYYDAGPTTVKINGVTVYNKERTAWDTYKFPAARGSVSGELDVAHNTGGSKTITCSITTAIYWGAASVETHSGTWTLDKIPRAATITSAPNFTDEDNPTVKYSNLAGSAVTSLEVCISDPAGRTTWAPYRTIPKNGTSYTFQLTDQEREALQNATPKSNTMQVKFVIRTTIAGAYYYSEAYKTLTIVNAAPTLDPYVEDVNEAITSKDFLTLVRYYSNAYFATGAWAHKGATIASQSCTCGGVTIQGATGTFDAVQSGSFIFTVTDSRGNTTTQTVDVPFVEYLKLTCSIGNGKPGASGDFALTASGVCYTGDIGEAGANNVRVYYRYKASGGSFGSWRSMAVTKAEASYEATAALTGLNYQTTYVFQCMAEDLVDTATTDEKSIKSMPVFDWGEDDFNFNVPVTAPRLDLTGGLSMGGSALADFIVDAGTQGDWIYRKWNSGLYECWGFIKGTTAVTGAWGNNFISTSGFKGTFPFAFTDYPIVQATPVYDGSGDFWIATDTAGTSKTQTATYQIVRPTSYASLMYKVNFYAIGRWK